MKPRNIISAVLIVAIITLAYFLYTGIMRPVKFESEFNNRSESVINRLKDIRTLQETFKSTNGRFCSSIDSLLIFAETGKVKMVIKSGIVPDSLTEAQALRAGIIKRDTVSVNPLRKLMEEKKLLIDEKDFKTLKYIPYSDNKVFEMKSDIINRGGVMVPVFEAKASILTFTKGMDEQDVRNRKAEIEGKDRYAGWKVGDLNQPIIDGNWE